jgi:hypothetical protein
LQQQRGQDPGKTGLQANGATSTQIGNVLLWPEREYLSNSIRKKSFASVSSETEGSFVFEKISRKSFVP